MGSLAHGPLNGMLDMGLKILDGIRLHIGETTVLGSRDDSITRGMRWQERG